MQEPKKADDPAARRSGSIFLGQVAVVVGLVALWHILGMFKLLDPGLFGTPAGVLNYLAEQLVQSNLWIEAGWTLSGVVLAFILGSLSAFLCAAVFVRHATLEKLVEPLFAALNSMPRIALAPMFIMWFGLGLASKIAAGFSLTFFIVLSATLAGVRGVEADHLTLARTMGASPKKIFVSIVIPGAVPTIFAGLRIGLIFSILGVVGSEIIASTHGLGQQIAYLSSTFDMNGVIAILIFMAAISNAISAGMTLVERHLMRWR